AEVERARTAFEHVDDDLGTARVELTRGRLALKQGELDVAAHGFEAARRIFVSRHLAADEMEADLRSAEVEVARSDKAGARRRLLAMVENGLASLRPDLVDEARRLGKRLGAPAIDVH
ncbi:MAG: hypothetical protein L3J87_04620, partial [Thermoplasmata archaeon]|nr:hypothetical protein [Thermoplasmata archaeon]